MIPIATISFLAGAVLGQWFRVLVLLPAFLLGLLLTACVELLHRSQGWSLGEMAGAAIVGLQIGYLFGMGIRYLGVLLRANRMARRHLGSALPERRFIH